MRKKRNYKNCQLCKCGDCKLGTYRDDSWFCPVLKRQICDVCCYYDMDAIENRWVRRKCKKIKCQYYNDKNIKVKNITGKDLQFGDTVFIDERSKWNLVGRILRIIQNGGDHPDKFFVPNHCGIVIEPNDDIHKVKIIQSALLGVKIAPLGLWSKHPKDNIAVRRYKKEIPLHRQHQMKRWLISKIGLPYDFLSMIPIFIKYFLLQIYKNPIIRHFIRHFPNPLDSPTRIICSEIIWRAWLEILGVLIWTGIHPGYISPYDEYRTKKFRTIGRYYNYDYDTEGGK